MSGAPLRHSPRAEFPLCHLLNSGRRVQDGVAVTAIDPAQEVMFLTQALSLRLSARGHFR